MSVARKSPAWYRWPAVAATAALGLSGLPAVGQVYGVEWVSTAAQGVAMGPSGRVIAGLVSLPPDCGGCPPSFNLPAIWADGRRYPVAVPAGAAYISFAGVNAQGWVAGSAVPLSAVGGQAFVWRLRDDGSGVDAVALGSLPGYSDATVAGIDDAGHVFGSAVRPGVASEPYVWGDGIGMSSLSAAGYPTDAPVAVSPGGTIATQTLTYRFGDTGSVSPVAPPPAGFHGNESTLTGAINDAGMRGSFLLATSSQTYRYLARYSDAAGWQVLAGPSGTSTRWGVGSVDAQGAVTGTVISAGLRAAGPDGPAQALAAMVSPAYGGGDVTQAGDQDRQGAVLADMVIGGAARLVRLVPTTACVSDCIRVSELSLSGRMISEPGLPGQCTPGARNRVVARVTVVDDAGAPMRGVNLRARLLDAYYLDSPVDLRTNSRGQATLRHEGPACVGAITLLIEDASRGGSRLDRRSGQLVGSVVPLPRRP